MSYTSIPTIPAFSGRKIPQSTRRQRVAAALGLSLALTGVFGVAQAQSTPTCELDRPVLFGGMSWESNLVLVEVERFIMEKGYGCSTDVLPTETLTALAALERGDLDINTEIWFNSMPDYWIKAEATGNVKRIGDIFMGRESWYIPRYTAEKLPELKHVADLPKFKDVFRDPEEPAKGRFYGCPAGWACEVVSTNQWKGLGLQDSFTMFSPGSGASQAAALTSAYQRKEDVVFYYWEPTPLAGALDLVPLEFPPHDASTFQCLSDPECPNPKASAYPENPVFTAVNTKFTQDAPTLTAFLSKVSVPRDVLNKVLAYMGETEAEPDVVARWFLQNDGNVWTQWVPADVAARVQAAL